MGPIPPPEYTGRKEVLHPITDCRDLHLPAFDAAYPFAIVNLEDNEMPVSAKAKVFNPLYSRRCHQQRNSDCRYPL